MIRISKHVRLRLVHTMEVVAKHKEKEKWWIHLVCTYIHQYTLRILYLYHIIHDRLLTQFKETLGDSVPFSFIHSQLSKRFSGVRATATSERGIFFCSN